MTPPLPEVMAPVLCDSHTHLDLFTEAELDGIVARAEAAGVGMIVTVGSTLASSERAVELAQRYPIVYAGVGMHPMDLRAPITDRDVAELARLATLPKVVCISETGLDYLPTSPDRRWQEEAFRRHIRLARELGKTIDFHSREACDAVVEVLREEGASHAGGIWHYFLGGPDEAREVMDLGLYISLAKPLLRIPELQEAAKRVPLDRIVLETDSYPQPFKKNPGRRTEPAHVRQVAEKLAEIKGMTVEGVAEATTANLRRVLRLS